MQYITSISYVDQTIKTFFQPTRTPYDTGLLDSILYNNQSLKHEEFYVTNRHNQKLLVSLITNRPIIEEKYLKYEKYIKNVPKNCIVYLHGFGSNRFQSLNLLLENQLMENYGLCSFDFSASGKSQGNYVSYGNKQKSDIQAILNFLKKKGFKKFILWGRSMGATCAILFNAVQQSNQQILLQILDSPFTSFQNAAKQVAKKKLNLPQFAFDILIDLVKTHCQKYQYNPFNVNAVKDIEKCIIPTIFLYSKNDSVLSYDNFEKIINHCKCKFQKIQIEENHNHLRNKQTIAKVFEIIQKYVRKNQKTSQKKKFTRNNYNKFEKNLNKIKKFQEESFSSNQPHNNFGYFNKKFNSIKQKAQADQNQKFNQYGLQSQQYINQLKDRLKTQNYNQKERLTLGRIQSLEAFHTANKKHQGFKFTKNYHNNKFSHNSNSAQSLKKKGLQRVLIKKPFNSSNKQSQIQKEKQILRWRSKPFYKSKHNSGGIWVSMKFDQNNVVNLNRKQRLSPQGSKNKKISRFTYKLNQKQLNTQKPNHNLYKIKSLYTNQNLQIQSNFSQDTRSFDKISSNQNEKNSFKSKYFRQKQSQILLPISSKVSSKKNFFFDSQNPNHKMDTILQASKSNQNSLIESSSYLKQNPSYLKLYKNIEVLSNHLYI